MKTIYFTDNQVTTFEFEKEMILDQDLFCYFDNSAFKNGIQTNSYMYFMDQELNFSDLGKTRNGEKHSTSVLWIHSFTY